MLDATSGQTNVLRRTLERKLAAKMKRSWVGGQQQGRLDSRRLVGAYTGSENIYKQREDSDDIDTAVMILIDHSMSMSGRNNDGCKGMCGISVSVGEHQHILCNPRLHNQCKGYAKKSYQK